MYIDLLSIYFVCFDHCDTSPGGGCALLMSYSYLLSRQYLLQSNHVLCDLNVTVSIIEVSNDKEVI